MSRLQVFFSAILLFTAVSAISRTPTPTTPPLRARRCGSTCRFIICGFKRAIISHPRFPITRPICFRGNKRIGQILSVGEARITPRNENFTKPISRLGFNGTKPYRRDFIHPVRTDLTLPNVSSLAVRYAPRPAIERLQGACIKVPITKWVENGVERTGRGCVSFHVQVPTVMVELQWDSNDDLDLFVVEPDGTSVFFQDGGGNGQLLRDVGRRSCGRVRRVGGKETIIYYANQVVKPGIYHVSAEHTKNCMETGTGWELRVVVRGRLMRRIRGVSRLREGGVIQDSDISFVVNDV